MLVAQLLRTVNRINPTSRGRHLVADLAYRFASLPPRSVIAIAPNIRMDLHMDDYIERSIYFSAYEFLLGTVLLKQIRPGGVFIDVGANVGYHTLRALRHVGPNGRVLAFEPNPHVLQRLKHNLAINRADNVELFEIALSKECEEVTIYCPTKGTHGLASLRNQGWENGEEYRVQAQPLDAVLPNDIPRIDLIKIDVEGAELLVLQGAERTIRHFKPAILIELVPKFTNVFAYNALDAVRLLLGYNTGYRIRCVQEHTIIETNLAELENSGEGDPHGNFLFY